MNDPNAPPLAAPVTREAAHHRALDFRGYRRSDGLYEIVGTIVDRKARDFSPFAEDKLVRAGEPIHAMEVCLVFDGEMVVREVRTQVDAFPYRDCARGGDALQALVGASMSRGWNNELRARLPRGEVCTHLREILTPLASAAYQTVTEFRRHLIEAELTSPDKPARIDSCYAYGASRERVQRLWPQYHRPPAGEA